MSQPAPDISQEAPATLKRGKLSLLWRPNLATEHRSLLLPHRLFMIGTALACVMLFLSLALGVALLAGAPVRLSDTLLLSAAMFISFAAAQTGRLMMLLHHGRWRRLDGQVSSRAERPTRFWTLVASHVAVPTAYVGLAVLFVWIAALPRR